GRTRELMTGGSLQLQGAKRGRYLVDLTPKSVERSLNERRADARRIGRGKCRAGRVVSVGLAAEENGRPIKLAGVHQVFDDSRGAAQAHGQHTRGGGVEGAGMTDP